MNQLMRPQIAGSQSASGAVVPVVPKKSRNRGLLVLVGVGVCGLIVLGISAAVLKTAGTQVEPSNSVAPGPLPSPSPSNSTRQSNSLPTPAVAPTAPPTPTPSFTEQVSASQQRAVKKHPDLGKAGSVLNASFVARVRLLQIEKSPRLQRANWPESIADEIAIAPEPAAAFGEAGYAATPNHTSASRVTPAPTDRVWVNGYTKKDGTLVEGH